MNTITKIILPIINKKTTLFKGPLLGLSPDISIRGITHEEYGLIYDGIPPEIKRFISTKTKCIIIDKVDTNNVDTIARNEGIKVAFLLNYFKQSQPVVISFAITTNTKMKTKVGKLINLPVIADVRLQNSNNQYSVRSGISSDTMAEYYKVISDVNDKYPNILLSLDRFSSALHRVQTLDKIIDITICLESLIDGTTELKNRFSLYNAWIAESDPARRHDCFELLGLLYNARSAVVHGITISEKEYKKKIDPISEKWEEIIKITENALGYYLLYIFQNGVEDWYKHQQRLVLGTEQRIV